MKRSRGRRTDGHATSDVRKPSPVSTDHPPRQTLKSAALAAAARGWRVFPLRPGTTTPAVQNWQQKATSDPEKINTAWDHGPYNVGLAPCPSGLLVLDLVPAGPGEHPPLRHRSPGTRTAQTSWPP